MAVPSVKFVLASVPNATTNTGVNLHVRAEVAVALTALDAAVHAAGGHLHFNSVTRDYAEQKKLHALYEAGKGAPANVPGKSHHNGGGAFDLRVWGLKFPGLPDNKQLDKLWEICKPLGWRPIIASPEEGASESWHFDFWGQWDAVRRIVGYEQACLATALDAGFAGDYQSDARLLQAHIVRCGYAIGDLDGSIGKRSIAACKALNVPADPAVAVPLLRQRPSLPGNAAVNRI